MLKQLMAMRQYAAQVYELYYQNQAMNEIGKRSLSYAGLNIW